MRTLTTVTFLFLSLIAAMSTAVAAMGDKVQSTVTNAMTLEGRAAGMLSSSNEYPVRADAVKWRQVHGATVPEADIISAGESVRTQIQSIATLGRS